MGGISGILGGIGLLGFLLFLGGIAMFVMSASQGRPVRSGVVMAITGLVIGILFSIIGQGVILVGASERAIVFNTLSGGLNPDELGPGTHIIVPIAQQATLYNVSLQEYTMSGTSNEGSTIGDDAVEARTQDGQSVEMDVSVIFRIDPTQVERVHVDWQDRYINGFVRPSVRGFVRDITSQFTAEEIYGEAREQLGQNLEQVVSARFQDAGFELNALVIRNVNFSDTFTQAIEEKVQAEQQAQQAEIRVRQQQQEAERVRVQAQGERDAAIARAEGQAQSAVLQARAQSEALRLISEQIAANPSLIQYLYIQNLSDNVRLVTIPSNSPFIFDLQNLIANPDFVAPQVPESSLDLSGQLIPESTPEAGG
jgi:prohibitin 2